MVKHEAARHAAGLLSESIQCLGLGLRDGLKPRLALMSFMVGLGVSLFWFAVFGLYAAELWQGAQSLASVGLIGTLKGVGEVTQALQGLVPVVMAGWFTKMVAAGLLLMGYALLVILSMRIILELVLMPRIQRVCLQRYPDLLPTEGATVMAGLRDTLGTLSTSVVGSLCCLLIPVIGGLLVLVLVSYMNIRSLLGDTLEDLATDDEVRQIIQGSRADMTVLGLACTALTLVPLLGLFAPVIMGASACHLTMRRLTVLRAAALLEQGKGQGASGALAT